MAKRRKLAIFTSYWSIRRVSPCASQETGASTRCRHHVAMIFCPDYRAAADDVLSRLSCVVSLRPLCLAFAQGSRRICVVRYTPSSRTQIPSRRRSWSSREGGILCMLSYSTDCRGGHSCAYCFVSRTLTLSRSLAYQSVRLSNSTLDQSTISRHIDICCIHAVNFLLVK